MSIFFILYKMGKLPAQIKEDIRGIKFEKGSGCHKYTAILPDGKKVGFGHRSYEHYEDLVPKSQGGQLWAHKNHKDPIRRERYRVRHTRVNKDGKLTKDVKYSSEWFSYYLLW